MRLLTAALLPRAKTRSSRAGRSTRTGQAVSRENQRHGCPPPAARPVAAAHPPPLNAQLQPSVVAGQEPFCEWCGSPWRSRAASGVRRQAPGTGTGTGNNTDTRVARLGRSSGQRTWNAGRCLSRAFLGSGEIIMPWPRQDAATKTAPSDIFGQVVDTLAVRLVRSGSYYNTPALFVRVGAVVSKLR